jgi:hypothetical protein
MLLRNETNTGEHDLRLAPRRPPEDTYLTGARLAEADHEVQERRLARAVRARPGQ